MSQGHFGVCLQRTLCDLGDAFVALIINILAKENRSVNPVLYDYARDRYIQIVYVMIGLFLLPKEWSVKLSVCLLPVTSIAVRILSLFQNRRNVITGELHVFHHASYTPVFF